MATLGTARGSGTCTSVGFLLSAVCLMMLRPVLALAEPGMRFEPNLGQTVAQVRFISRGRGYTVYLTPSETVIALRRPESSDEAGSAGESLSRSRKYESLVLRVRLVGATPELHLEGEGRTPGRSNYLLGNDRTRWRADIPNFTRVRSYGVYPGVDMVYYGKQNALEYDFVVAPGVDPRVIRLEFRGADGLRLDSQGNLNILLGDKQITQHAPVIYQDVDGTRQSVQGQYAVQGDRQVTIEIGSYDKDRPLVIDPLVLGYSTYLGGSGNEDIQGLRHNIAVDGQGNFYLTGETSSANFPSLSGFQPGFAGGGLDAFVTKLDPNGMLVYSTYLGGNAGDEGRGIALVPNCQSNCQVFVTGRTASGNFPVTIGPPYAGGFDVFAAKLNAAGNALVYSRLIGGTSLDLGLDIAVDLFGRGYVTGSTSSASYPVTPGAFDTIYNGATDAFVTRLTPGGGLSYSTFLGGSGYDAGQAIAVRGSTAYLTGGTESANFPLASPAQTALAGIRNGFVTRVNVIGSGLVFSTYYGGSTNDFFFDIAVCSDATATVTGVTINNFPATAGVVQFTDPNAGFAQDAVVAKFSGIGALQYASYLGGSSGSFGYGVAVDCACNAYVVGSTDSTNFPVLSAVQPTNGGLQDVFVTKLNPTGTAFIFSTYLGGSNGDEGGSIAVDVNNDVYIAGRTASTNFPVTAAAVQSSFGGGVYDLFVTKLQ